jgi:hypothetical protein
LGQDQSSVIPDFAVFLIDVTKSSVRAYGYLRTATTVAHISRALHIGVQRRQLDQPDLADFDAFEATVSQEASEVLNAITREFGRGLD